MCCPLCLQYAGCHGRTEIHADKTPQYSMPNPHYHLCRLAVTACDFNCKRCGRLTREMPHLIPAHFAYGCCHRCAAYRGCNFMDRHRRVLAGGAATVEVRHVPTEFKDGQPVIPAALAAGGAAMPPQSPATSSPPA